MAVRFATKEYYKGEDLWGGEFDGDDASLSRRLRDASAEVSRLTRFAIVDYTDGLPTDAVIATAFQDATCAIVEHWEDTGDSEGTAISEGAVKIGSVSLGTTSSDTEQIDFDRTWLGAKAFTILGNAGLLAVGVAH